MGARAASFESVVAGRASSHWRRTDAKKNFIADLNGFRFLARALCRRARGGADLRFAAW